MPETIVQRTCWRCKKTKPIAEFFRDKSRKGGHQYDCKACRKCDKRTPKRLESRHEYQKSDTFKTTQRRYKQSDKGKSRDKRQRFKYPNRMKARSAVNRAVRMGYIPAATKLVCGDCGNPAQHWHHTHGYARGFWLHIRAVCLPCHTLLHPKSL